MKSSRTSTLLLLLLAAVSSGCNNQDSSSSITAPSGTAVNEVLTGTVQPPVNGVLQAAFNQFTIAASGGDLSVTLTSAVETLPGGTLLTTVTMGLGVGLVSSGTCTLIANAYTTAQGGSTPQLSGSSVSAGSYCVQLSDVSNQLGPVAYAVSVSHY